MKIEVGQKLKVRIEKLSLGGDGIARVPSDEGQPFVVFVPYSAPGDELEIQITDKRKTFAKAQLLRILNQNPNRISPPCPYYFSENSKLACGGCDFQHLSYPTQLQQKILSLKET